MTAARWATIAGLLFGGIASLVGLVLILAAGIGLLILPWSATVMLSGLVVRSDAHLAYRFAQFSLGWAVIAALLLGTAISSIGRDLSPGIFILWAIVMLPIPLLQCLLTRAADRTMRRIG